MKEAVVSADLEVVTSELSRSSSRPVSSLTDGNLALPETTQGGSDGDYYRPHEL